MTTRSARQDVASAAMATGSATSTAAGSATARVPALPGAQASAVTAGSGDRATHRACSRAPEPITSTRTDGDPTQSASPEPVRLRPVRPVQGADSGVLGGPGAGVGAQRLAVRLGLQLAPGRVAGRVQPAVLDCGGHGARSEEHTSEL